MADLARRRRLFRDLHASGCFVMPNPWDIGSARLLASLGFRALATTSGGFAFSRGLPDGAVSRDEMLAHIAEIVAATESPVNADFQAGYADLPEAVAANVRLCIATGVAGLSIEDMREDHSLYDFSLAVERVQAARAAIDASGDDVVLTARSESFVAGHPDPLREACRRLNAFADAGADVLFAPGALDSEAISAIVAAVSPKPINVMATAKNRSVAELALLGVRRVSLASALARAALGGFLRVAREIAERGTFDGFASAAPAVDLNRFFRDEEWRR
ncbi:MAG: isocitrate lyase/PEP mutase family protein [Candidatus Binatia bacterium]